MVSSVRRCTKYMSPLYGLKVSALTSCQAMKDNRSTLVTYWPKLRKMRRTHVHGRSWYQSWGLYLLLSATKDMHGCLAILCPLKQYFSHAMAKKLSAMRWCIGQAVIAPWTLWFTFGSTNRSVTRSLRQLLVLPLCRSAVMDIAALPTAFLSFAWRCSYLAHWLLMMSRWQRRFSDYWYDTCKSRSSILETCLTTRNTNFFHFYGRCSHLAHQLLKLWNWKKGFGLPIKGQDDIYLASELADAMVID